MILTGTEISFRVRSGQIGIDPFDPANLNPNSYNLRLGSTLLEYRPDSGGFHSRSPAGVRTPYAGRYNHQSGPTPGKGLV